MLLENYEAKLRKAILLILLAVSFFHGIFFYFLALLLGNLYIIKSSRNGNFKNFLDSFGWKELFGIFIIEIILFFAAGTQRELLAIIISILVVILLGVLMFYSVPKVSKNFYFIKLPSSAYRGFIFIGISLLLFGYIVYQKESNEQFRLFLIVFCLPMSILLILYGILGPRIYSSQTS